MSVAPAPRTVIGTPLFNHADYLAPALDSLLAQTDSNLALVLVDDGSTDGTDEIALRYAERHPRITFTRNESRLGLVGNWRRCFELARELYPDADYFAWGSDHDLWHPRWLAVLAAELEADPNVVLAYPVCERITAEGEVAFVRGCSETQGNGDPASRLRLGCSSLHAGDMVYGLMRTGSLRSAGVFRRVLEPDRLLLAELAVQGEFRHVAEPLWQRRFVKTAVRARQRRAIFPHRRPLYSWLAPWIVRPAVFGWVYGVRGAGEATVTRPAGLRLAGAYAQATVRHMIVRRYRQLRKKLSRTKKRILRYRKRTVRAARRMVGARVRAVLRAARRYRRLAAAIYSSATARLAPGAKRRSDAELALSDPPTEDERHAPARVYVPVPNGHVAAGSDATALPAGDGLAVCCDRAALASQTLSVDGSSPTATGEVVTYSTPSRSGSGTHATPSARRPDSSAP